MLSINYPAGGSCTLCRARTSVEKEATLCLPCGLATGIVLVDFPGFAVACAQEGARPHFLGHVYPAKHDATCDTRLADVLCRQPCAGLAELAQAISPVKGAASFLRLPAQKRIGHIVNYIPDVGRVAAIRTGDFDYVPHCS